LLATARLRFADPGGARGAADTAAEASVVLGSAGGAAAAALVGAAADHARGQDATAAYEALTVAHVHGMRPLVVDGLTIAGALARDADRPSVAARLHGAAERLRGDLGAAVSPLGALLWPDSAFLAANADALAEGARLGQAGAVGYAVRNRGRRGRPKSGWDSLTPAERQVAALAAQGRSNPEIAASLLVSTATVRTHLRSVYAKLHLTNRAALAAAFALRGL
jgi:DNA-binding CsgD family transcriptional regulator